MNSTHHGASHEVFVTDPTASVLKDLKVRALEPQEYKRAGELLNQEHYLGDVPQGRQLLQVVEYEGQWVALLDWGPATWKLATGKNGLAGLPSRGPNGWPWWCSTAVSWSWAKYVGPIRSPGRWRWRSRPCPNSGSRPTAISRSWPRPSPTSNNT